MYRQPQRSLTLSFQQKNHFTIPPPNFFHHPRKYEFKWSQQVDLFMESSRYMNELNNYLVFLSSYVNAHDLAGLYMCWAAEGPEECRKLIAKLMILNMVCQPVLPTHINKCLNFLFVFPFKWILRFRFRGKSENILIYQMCMFYFSLFHL